jgi:hypothetical protein
VNDKEIDDIIERSAGVPHEVDPALLSRVSIAMTASLRPVRPMAPAWMLAAGLMSISVIVASVSAWWLGFYGVRKLSVAEIASIFPALLIFSWLVAMMSAGAITPGSRRWMNPAMLLLLVVAGWIALDAVLFRDYDLGAFLPQGVSCLRAGLVVAIPTGIGGWLLLRRGFAVNPAGAGLAAGTLAGLAGLVMLEIHCPNLRAPHVMVWHTAVVPVSALAGAIVAKISGRG